MAAALQPMHVPLEVYLRSSYEPDAEYVDGVIEERPSGEYDHSSWQYAIQPWFARHAQDWGIRVRPELRVQISRSRFRVPDVAVLDRSLSIEQIVTHPPIAVFEILSPEDSLHRMMTKLADYEHMGVRTVLLLNPGGQHFRFLSGRLEPLPREPFDLPGSACRFDLAEVEKLLD
ncbi:MAG: Uma2 family endonuclease [Terracidiphilus sp.]